MKSLNWQSSYTEKTPLTTEKLIIKDKHSKIRLSEEVYIRLDKQDRNAMERQ